MKIFIFGSTGMLGRYVTSYLKKRHYHIIPITRADIDISNINITSLNVWFMSHGGIHIGDVVINCAGLIRQKMSDADTLSAIKINSIFPHIVNDLCKNNYVNFLHISTDCCFSGKKGEYYETDIPDPTDIYGITKVAGEPLGSSVIRTSIIGESTDDKSLLEWVRTQNGQAVSGFIDHLWNGVTCLEFARVIDKIISNHLWWNGIRHYFSGDTNKAELVTAIATVYGINLTINYTNAPNAKNMLLRSNYKELFDDKPLPDIFTQLREQKDFKL